MCVRVKNMSVAIFLNTEIVSSFRASNFIPVISSSINLTLLDSTATTI